MEDSDRQEKMYHILKISETYLYELRILKERYPEKFHYLIIPKEKAIIARRDSLFSFIDEVPYYISFFEFLEYKNNYTSFARKLVRDASKKVHQEYEHDLLIQSERKKRRRKIKSPAYIPSRSNSSSSSSSSSSNRFSSSITS